MASSPGDPPFEPPRDPNEPTPIPPGPKPDPDPVPVELPPPEPVPGEQPPPMTMGDPTQAGF